MLIFLLLACSFMTAEDGILPCYCMFPGRCPLPGCWAPTDGTLPLERSFHMDLRQGSRQWRFGRGEGYQGWEWTRSLERLDFSSGRSPWWTEAGGGAFFSSAGRLSGSPGAPALLPALL